MTGVQTCALPICFPVTIGEGIVIVEDTGGALREYSGDAFDVFLNSRSDALKWGVKHLYVQVLYVPEV